MTEDDEFIRELLRRRDVEDSRLAAAQKHHAERIAAINVLLESAGYTLSERASRPDSSTRHDATGSSKRTALAIAANGGPTTRDHIKDALRLAGMPMKMSDIVRAVAAQGSTASEDTVRTVLQKMLHAKQVTRPDRGMYGLPLLPDSPVPDQEVLDLVEKAEASARTQYPAEEVPKA